MCVTDYVWAEQKEQAVDKERERERENGNKPHFQFSFGCDLELIWFACVMERCECKVLQIVVKRNVITHFYYGIFGVEWGVGVHLSANRLLNHFLLGVWQCIQENNDLCIQNDTQC